MGPPSICLVFYDGFWIFCLEGRIRPLFLFYLPGQQVSLEVPIEHELHDGVDWLVASADAQQFDDVLVVEALHHVGLAEEIQFLFDRRAGFQRFHGHGHLQLPTKQIWMLCVGRFN